MGHSTGEVGVSEYRTLKIYGLHRGALGGRLISYDKFCEYIWFIHGSIWRGQGLVYYRGFDGLWAIAG
jgi:hypothetical protein